MRHSSLNGVLFPFFVFLVVVVVVVAVVVLSETRRDESFAQCVSDNDRQREVSTEDGDGPPLRVGGAPRGPPQGSGAEAANVRRGGTRGKGSMSISPPHPTGHVSIICVKNKKIYPPHFVCFVPRPATRQPTNPPTS